MARALKKLNARQVATLAPSGPPFGWRWFFGHQALARARRWVFLFVGAASSEEIGLVGSRLGLARGCREKADEARRALGDGRNPMEKRHTQAADRDTAPNVEELSQINW